jgi:hypothetical protein
LVVGRGNTTTRAALGVLALAALLAAPGRARGQTNSYARMLDTTRTLQQNLFDEMNRANAQRAKSEKIVRGAQPPARAQRPAAHLPLAMTDFRPIDAGHPVLTQFLAGLQMAPGPRATMQQAIGQVWAAMEAKVRPNNLAASLGIAVAVSTLVLTGKDESDAALAEQIARINDVIAVSPLWMGMQARGKQQLSDSLLLTTSVMLVYSEAGKTEPAFKQASQEIGRDILARVGVAMPAP